MIPCKLCYGDVNIRVFRLIDMGDPEIVEVFSYEELLGDIILCENCISTLFNLVTSKCRKEKNMISILEKTATEVATKLAPKNAIIDPASISRIADIIFMLIEMCRERQPVYKVAESIDKPRFIERIATRRAVRRELTRQEWRANGPEIVRSLLIKAEDAEKSVIVELIKEIDEA